MSKKTQRERQERVFRRKIVVVVGCVLVVLVAATLGLVWFLGTQQRKETETVPTDTQAQTEANVARSKRDGQLHDNAAESAKKGDTAKVAQLYDEAVANESDINRKVQLYVDQSNVLYTAGRFAEAFEAAKKAEGLSKDKFVAADWLSRIYEDQKDYVNAAKYYTLAGQWATSPQNVYKLTKVYYDREAARVTALEKAQQ
jgi:tetratricopeptide (TPR) repeat protein